MSLIKPLIVSILFFVFSCALYFFHKYLWEFGFVHPKKNPYEYIFLASCCLLLVNYIFNISFIKNNGFKNNWFRFLFLLIWILLMETSGAFLWSYHDMGTTNYTGNYRSFTEKAIHQDIFSALYFGTLFLLVYFPFNAIALFGLNFLINKVYKLKSTN